MPKVGDSQTLGILISINSKYSNYFKYFKYSKYSTYSKYSKYSKYLKYSRKKVYVSYPAIWYLPLCRI